ncbi:MAG: 3-phosphoshikimate 1-carboxyvinyltransferase, partial [Planctomycetaceae bacterium]|nr:3-phosphoshikimate 1-carboxyvinyltransferase [Planctomycetaceae bacterium]
MPPYPAEIVVEPWTGSSPIVVVRVPGSKSLTNRALVIAAMADGKSTLSGALDSDDTRVMVQALQNLGIAVEHDRSASVIRLEGCGGRLPVQSASLFVGNSGTSLRFLTAMLAAAEGTFLLDGTPRMQERPVDDLLMALRSLGAIVRSDRGNGCPPVTVETRGLEGGYASVRGDVSSQFLSGLLM